MKRIFVIGILALAAVVCVSLVSLNVYTKMFWLRSNLIGAEYRAEHCEQQLTHARVGSTLLYRMALTKDYDDVFGLIRTIPPESLACDIMEMPEYPPIRLVSFSFLYRLPDGSVRPMEQCKTVDIIVNSKTLDVIDHVLHEGCISTSVKGSRKQFYVLHKYLPDDTSRHYEITPTGFRLR